MQDLFRGYAVFLCLLQLIYGLPSKTVESVRPTILDYPALRLVPVGRSLGSGQTRDSRRLASGGVSTFL
jgi:hypothetical protein